MQIQGNNKYIPQVQYNSCYGCGNSAPAFASVPATSNGTVPTNGSAAPGDPPSPCNINIPQNANGVNIQIFNPTVATPGSNSHNNVNAPNYYCYPSGYYTTQMGLDGKNSTNSINDPYKPGGLLDPNDPNNPYGADPKNPNNPYRPGGAFDPMNPNNPYKKDSGFNPNDPNSPNNPYRPGGPLDPNNPNNPYGADPKNPNNPYRPGGPLDPNNNENKYGAGGLLDPNNPVNPYYQSSNNTENNTTTNNITDEKKSEKKRIVMLNDDYIKNLEDFLNSPDKARRLNAAKQVFERLDEDPSRKDDKALTALINKMLQDPSQEIRLLALSALDGRICNGDPLTVQLLQNMQSNPKDYGFDANDASRILLDMSAQRIDKDVPIDPDKRTKIKTEEKKDDKKKSQIKSNNKKEE